MDVSEVRLLAAAGETFTVEFKSEQRHPFNDTALVEAVVCLANGHGGILLLGIEDDGTITGARPRHGKVSDPGRVEALLSNRTIPPIETTVSTAEVDHNTVLIVEVEKSKTVVGTTGGLYVRRALSVDGTPTCVPYAAHEMLASEIDRGALDYAAIAEPHATMADLDPLEFERFRSVVARSGASADNQLPDLSNEEILRALGVAKLVDGTTRLARGALLLFGRARSIERFIPTHEVAFQVLRGDKVETNEFSRDPLFKAAELLFDRVQSRNPEEEVEYGLLRINIPLVPPVATREAIANALVHRDYTQLGPVRVQFEDDGIEITNPGGFPTGVTLNNLLDSSQPRSPLLAGAFKRIGLVERTGRGVNRIYDSLLRIGREAPDYSRSTDHRVTVVLPTTAADLPLVRFMIDHEESTGQRFRLADIQILHELRREPRLSVPEIAKVLQKSESETRTALGRMLENGLVEQRGNGRTRRYMLTAVVYRSLESTLAYVRVHPFDDIQHEQMVLKYIEAQGSITRKQAGDLCGLTPSQSGTLLHRMRAVGAIALRGEKRGSHYVLERQ